MEKELDSLKETGLRLADEVKEAKAAREKVLVLRTEKKRLQQIQQQKEALTGEIAQLTLRFRRPDFAELLDELRKTGDLPSDELEKCCNLWNREWQDERDLDTVLAAVEAVLEQSGTRRAAKEKDFNERLQEASNTLTRYSTEKENIIRALDQVQAKKKLLADDLAALEQEKKNCQIWKRGLGRQPGKPPHSMGWRRPWKIPGRPRNSAAGIMNCTWKTGRQPPKRQPGAGTAKIIRGNSEQEGPIH